MGRHRKPENEKLSATERKRRSRQHPEVRERERIKAQEKDSILKETGEARLELRDKWRQRKKTQRENQSKQKKYVRKMKDKFPKRRIVSSELKMRRAKHRLVVLARVLKESESTEYP